VFAAFKETPTYFGSAQNRRMVNFPRTRSGRNDRTAARAGCTVETAPQDYPKGRFVRRYDPEGNPIGQWEPRQET
jgi:predicted enzyme related to lactoylglutathione lyase